MRLFLSILFVICIGGVIITPVAAESPYLQPSALFSGFPFPSVSSPLQGESGVIAAGLIVISTPPGGDVYVDGGVLGKTPCTLPGLPSGLHIITIRMNGYKDWTRTILIRDRHTVNLNAVLVLSEITPVPTVTPGPTLTRPSIIPPGTPVPLPVHTPFIFPKPTLIRPSITPLGTPVPLPVHTPFIFPKPTMIHPSITPLGTPIPVLSLYLIDAGRGSGLL